MQIKSFGWNFKFTLHTALDKKIHILYLCSWFPNKYIPFLGNFVENHAFSIANTCTVSCLYVRANLELSEQVYQVDYRRKEGVDGWVVYYRNSNNILVKTWRYIQSHYLGRKLAIARNGKVDILHLHVIKPAGFIAYLWNMAQRIPFMVTEHSTAYLEMNREKMGFTERYLVKKVLEQAQLVTVVSAHLGENLKAFGKIKKMEVLNNVVDSQHFFPDDKKDDSFFTFIHISTLVEEHKNAGGIIRAFSKLTKEVNHTRLWIISDGDFSYCKHLAQTLELSEKISFMGPLESMEVAEKLRQSHCLVLFSNYENMPVVISEAWMCGIPVISSDVGGIREHVKPINGLLIKPGDEEGLLQAMKRMIEDKNKYDSAQISEGAKKEFSSLAVGIKLKKYYLDILG